MAAAILGDPLRHIQRLPHCPARRTDAIATEINVPVPPSTLREIPRRTRASEEGFDALGIFAVRCRNDGTPVVLWPDPPAPQPGDIFEYDAMIRRVADAYEARHK